MTDRRRSRPTTRSKTVTAVRPAISAGRVRVLGLVFVLVFGAFAYRLVDLQVTPDPTLADSAGRHIDRVDLPATRGSFVDRYGDEVPWAGDLAVLAATEDVREQPVGLLLESATSRVAYIQGCAKVPDWLLDRLEGIDLLLFDGTVWNNDDMARTGTGEKTGARMGHLPLNGAGGSLERFAGLGTRKMLIHINNTNPILQPESAERAEVISKGWEIAQDGMEITL